MDVLVVGAGLFGAVCARLLADAGKSVQVIEKREHIGGNVYDEKIGDLWVNRYGGHIFHTNSRRIWEFVNRFSEWIPYEHRVKCKVGYKLYSFPVNMMTLQQVYAVRNLSEACQLTDGKLTARLKRLFYEGYSYKQWGSETPPGAIERIPVRLTWDDRYYSDRWQGMPVEGYTRLIWRILGEIPVVCNADYLADRDFWNGQARQIVYSGSLDELFGCDLGRLPYRSLRWENQTKSGDFQGCATVNYCDREVPWTRILEWQHYGHRSRAGESIITYEYAENYEPGKNEPIYPVRSKENLALHRQYEERLPANVQAGGRLGSYQYLNMDQTIGQAMRIVEELTGEF